VRSFAEKVGQADAVVSVGEYENDAFLIALTTIYDSAAARSKVIKTRRDDMAKENKSGFAMISETIRQLS